LIRDFELVWDFNLLSFSAILPPSLSSSLASQPLAHMYVCCIVGCKLAVIKSNGQYVPMPPSLESAIFPHQPVNRVADATRALTAILEMGPEGWPPIKVIAIGNGTAGA
jgi:transcriptional accessory protein Tex/SPT6